MPIDIIVDGHPNGRQDFDMYEEYQSEYRIYTRDFDIEIDANHLDTILGPLSAPNDKALNDAWITVQSGMAAWRTQLHILAANIDAYIRSCLTREALDDTSVTLLIDLSGSMRGQKMLFAAATADVVQEFLVTLGVKCEVLGFTTVRWIGGRSRRQWNWDLRPPNPGRLSDLLHIVFKRADDLRGSTGSFSYRQMFRQDLPKENIDGEAIEWASRRLLSQNSGRKLLIILSDGAPVDDSTLMENGPHYLLDHHQSVVSRIVADGKISIGSLGIGYDMAGMYPYSACVEAPAEMGRALLKLSAQMLTGE